MTTTPAPATTEQQTTEDYARRTAVATETLVKFAKAWTAIVVVLAAVGLLIYLQTTQGPTVP
jgi:hypothetical protein